MSSSSYSTLPIEQRVPLVASGDVADAARPVQFDRPLVEQAGWADPRIARQLAEATRAARTQGLAEGWAAGWAQGRQAAAAAAATEAAERAARDEAARQALAARTQAVLAAVAQSARALADEVLPAWDGLVDALLEGALALAGAALGRDLATVDAEVLEAARTALRVLPNSDPVTLHVHPADLELFAGCADAALDGVRLVADAAVAPGAVLARSPLQSLPVDLRGALRAAEEVLRP